MRWLGKSVGEPIARDAKQMTLFIPNGLNGFVSREDGLVTLKLAVQLPEDSSWTWNELVLEGEPSHFILQTAEKLNSDLIVMTTDGPDGFLDGLRGTTSERVLSKSNCPVANLPVDSMLG